MAQFYHVQRHLMSSMSMLHFLSQFPWKDFANGVFFVSPKIVGSTAGTRKPALTFILRQSRGQCLPQLPIVFEILHVNIFGKLFFRLPCSSELLSNPYIYLFTLILFCLVII